MGMRWPKIPRNTLTEKCEWEFTAGRANTNYHSGFSTVYSSTQCGAVDQARPSAPVSNKRPRYRRVQEPGH